MDSDFEKTLSEQKVQHSNASIAYPQSNGQYDIKNKAILQGIKKRLLVEDDRIWVNELPNMLWSHRTTLKALTGEIPFKMAYGVEAVLLIEIIINSYRVKNFDPKSS